MKTYFDCSLSPLASTFFYTHRENMNYNLDEEKARVGHFDNGRFHEIASGTKEYCQGFLDAYNLYTDVCAVMLVGSTCKCGPKRIDHIKPEDKLFCARTGCLRCGLWDSPVLFASSKG